MKLATPYRFVRSLASLAIATLLVVGLGSQMARAEAVSVERLEELRPLVASEFNLSEFSVQRLTIPQARDRNVSLTVQIDGKDHELTIVPYRVFSPDYKLLVDLGDGRIEEMPSGEVTTFRGTLKDVTGSVVAGGWVGEGLVAKIATSAKDTFWIQPLTNRIEGATAQEHIVYRSKDSLPHGGQCATTDEMIAASIERGDEAGTRGVGCGGGVCVTDLACDADFEYFNDYGSVVATQNRIASVINAMNVQFETEVGITHQIVTIIVRTAPTYGSNVAGTLLDQFRSRWLSSHTNIARDVAHLFTGKNLVAPAIGVAWPSTICASLTTGLGFSLVESDFNGNFSCATDLSAHELGHNWSALHCGCPSNTMNSSITCANTFHAASTIPGIINYRDSRPCLSPFESGTTTLPFFDDFPSTTLDSTKWTGIEGAASNTGGDGEPSSPNSLNIEGSDQIRSAIIDTSVPLGLDISYSWQRTGSGNSPEPGEDLIVEYLDSSQLWIELASHPGAGPDGDPFTFESFAMPADALHASFRLRFRGTSPNSGFDDWFIDDIGIDGCFGASVAPEPQPVSDCPGANVQFTTAGTGGEPITYQWFKDGVMLNDGGGITGSATDTLSINGIVDPADEGNYDCELTNVCGTLSTQAAALTVLDPVSITTQPPATVSACTGEVRIITLTAAGDGLTYEWRKDGVLLPDGGNISGATTASLSISNIALSDAANAPGYVCTVLDNCGNFVASSAAVLDITGAEVTSQPADSCVDTGELATFGAAFTAPGGFATFVQWHKDGSPITDGGNISGAFTDTLTINPATITDVGGYSLRILVIGPNCVNFSNEGQLTVDDCGCTLDSECDDSNPCTDDICDGILGCLNTNNTDPCDDGDACTTVDACSGGSCVGSIPLVCDDTNDCTDDTCDSGTGCVFTNNVDPCDDGDACTTADACSGGSCTGGVPQTCDDANPCTTDTCDSGTGCVFTNNTDPCDDGDACTTVDACSGGSCVGSSPLVCDDANICTDDTCDPGTGCVFTDNTDPCDDGDACTTVDVCDTGACTGSVPPTCDNGLFCDGLETCDSIAGCQGGTDPCVGPTWCNEPTVSCVAYGDGDINSDGNIDLIDFQAFQSCFGFPAGGGCEPLNLTGDALIDLADLDAFVNLLTGP